MLNWFCLKCNFLIIYPRAKNDCYLIELGVLNSNTWKLLMVCKQMIISNWNYSY